jgi:hypothetical protein
MATAKRSTASGRKSPAARSRTKSAQAAGAAKTKRAQAARPASASRAPKNTPTNGAKRSRATSSKASAASKNGSAGRRASTRARPPQPPDGVIESVKHAGASALRSANRASGPTVTVAAAVAGIAGGLLLRQRPKYVVRDGIGARSRELLHDIDPSAVIEGIGRASMLVSQRSKSLARDIDQVADRAERLSKVLR